VSFDLLHTGQVAITRGESNLPNLLIDGQVDQEHLLGTNQGVECSDGFRVPNTVDNQSCTGSPAEVLEDIRTKSVPSLSDLLLPQLLQGASIDAKATLLGQVPKVISETSFGPARLFTED